MRVCEVYIDFWKYGALYFVSFFSDLMYYSQCLTQQRLLFRICVTVPSQEWTSHPWQNHGSQDLSVFATPNHRPTKLSLFAICATGSRRSMVPAQQSVGVLHTTGTEVSNLVSDIDRSMLDDPIATAL